MRVQTFVTTLGCCCNIITYMGGGALGSQGDLHYIWPLNLSSTFRFCF